ncbi:uracil-DNA glycosylase 2-like protein [Dinothrombium tinctorium]|uniref:Uracil-DNA glycosylase n=1 Tax=Dinothrombium tinctorium TaxID=1965070 RepID=A0A3S3PW71_9ACAR|nr:uracil-DNA glycosylase 2-like protein [Dinothrombium tinctorium]
MSQKTITSFFKPAQNSKLKRELSADCVHNVSKRSKSEQINGDHNRDAFEEIAIAKIKKQSILTPALSDNIGVSWFTALQTEFNKDYFKKLSDFLVNERQSHTIYPPESEVFTWTRMANIRDTKVVILGQDPYHGPNQAHGLAFSVKKGVVPPPSLKNMFQELRSDIDGFCEPNHGDLSGWSKQGVLLLNACLTVRKHEANSHSSKGWEQLTDAVIKWLNSNLYNVVFLLWGSYAQKKGSFVDKKKHLVLQCPHPSPLSAHRGFLGCKHFSKANEYLRKNGKKEIDWNYLP